MGLETTALLAWASVAVAAVGTGYGISASLAAGEDAKRAADFNAAVEENNALASAQQAQYEADRVNKRNRILMGKQRAAYAKSGVVGGSQHDVEFDSMMEAELDRMAVLYTGRIASNAHRSSSQLARLQGQNAKASGQRRAMSTLFSGAGDTLDAYGSAYRITNNPDIK